ncbi:putative hydrolase [metagenome]|uniref:Putative hydrolase n=1 Tax=metagenome TaxID=256318 RepID=A0A2P2BXS2_9ZZZZ
MINPSGASLAMDAEGNQVLALRRCAERELDLLEPRSALARSLVVATYGGEVLLVHNSWRLHWELPGGLLGPGESARHAAERAFFEETGLGSPALEFLAVVTFELVPDRRREYAAAFLAPLDRRPEVGAFLPNEEIGGLRWWDLKEELPDSADLDLWIAEHALGR